MKLPTIHRILFWLSTFVIDAPLVWFSGGMSLVEGSLWVPVFGELASAVAFLQFANLVGPFPPGEFRRLRLKTRYSS